MLSHLSNAFFPLPYPQAFNPTNSILITLHNLALSPKVCLGNSRRLHFALWSTDYHEAAFSAHSRPALAAIFPPNKTALLTPARFKSKIYSKKPVHVHDNRLLLRRFPRFSHHTSGFPALPKLSALDHLSLSHPHWYHLSYNENI